MKKKYFCVKDEEDVKMDFGGYESQLRQGCSSKWYSLINSFYPCKKFKTHKTKNMTEQILERLNLLKYRPLMFIGSGSFTSKTISEYLVGFIGGLDFCLGLKTSLHKQLFLWLRKKTKIDYDISWYAIIWHFYSNKSDEELKLLIIETLEDFFKENPDWDKKE